MAYTKYTEQYILNKVYNATNHSLNSDNLATKENSLSDLDVWNLIYDPGNHKLTYDSTNSTAHTKYYSLMEIINDCYDATTNHLCVFTANTNFAKTKYLQPQEIFNKVFDATTKTMRLK